MSVEIVYIKLRKAEKSVIFELFSLIATAKKKLSRRMINHGEMLRKSYSFRMLLLKADNESKCLDHWKAVVMNEPCIAGVVRRKTRAGVSHSEKKTSQRYLTASAVVAVAFGFLQSSWTTASQMVTTSTDIEVEVRIVGAYGFKSSRL